MPTPSLRRWAAFTHLFDLVEIHIHISFPLGYQINGILTKDYMTEKKTRYEMIMNVVQNGTTSKSLVEALLVKLKGTLFKSCACQQVELQFRRFADKCVAQCTLDIAHCTLHITRCTLHIARCRHEQLRKEKNCS